jgi:hypothetical protein
MEKERKERTFRRRTHSFSMLFFFVCVCIDDKKMERLFSSVPPSNIEKRDKDTMVPDR